jgi:CubicO group peptidase (beta-lactamase class C family)
MPAIDLTTVRLLALSALLFCSHAPAAEPISSAQIDALVERAMKTFDVPGIAVAVIKDDQLVHAKGYGVRSLKSGQRVDPHTLFGIASNSKAFTAAALAMLVDEKKLKWTDKVTDYLPGFKMYNPYVTDEFTVLDLLTHRSGLGLGAGDLMMFPDGADFTRADVIRNLRFLKPVSSFRAKYDYDNNLYIVAGEVVARVAGIGFEDFIEQRIMTPLGMRESAASLRRLKDARNVVVPHVAIEGRVQPVDAEIGEVANAAGGIYSNLSDMTLWVRMQLAAGKYGDGKHLFSEAAQHMMWTPQTIIPVGRGPTPYNTHFASYGLGWGLSDVKGYKQVAHTGGLIGMVTQVTLIPELKLGIVVLTNQQVGQAFASISNTIKDAYFGMAPTDRVAEMSKQLGARTGEADQTVAAVWSAVAAAQAGATAPELATYAGTYRDNWLGEVTLAVKDGSLRFSSKRSPKLSGVMSYYKGTTFVVKWGDRSLDADAFVNFSLGNDGKPRRMTMAAISPMTDFSFDFQDLDFELVK